MIEIEGFDRIKLVDKNTVKDLGTGTLYKVSRAIYNPSGIWYLDLISKPDPIKEIVSVCPTCGGSLYKRINSIAICKTLLKCSSGDRVKYPKER